ncbi:outer membrane beta-barrel protein [Vibrio maritimus]|uniref:outer membrane beta-barrel protein n=1 Tax=Vibrio maritimus TaxID=990268 RepID=UPI004067E285
MTFTTNALRTTAGLLLLHSLSVLANELPEGHFVNGVTYLPSLELYTGYNDNLLYQSDEQEKKKTEFVYLVPQMAAAIEEKSRKHYLEYKAFLGQYFNSQNDDFVDHYVTAENELRLSLRNAIELNGAYSYQHESRGQGTSSGNATLIDSPIKFHYFEADLGYRYGAPGAKGQLAFSLEWNKKKYANYTDERDSSIGLSTRLKDYDLWVAGVSFSSAWRQGVNATLSYEHERKTYPFQREGSTSQDSFNHLIYAGLDWDIAQKTKGYLKLGVQDKNFLDSQREDFTGFSWATGIKWTPVRHSTISFNSSQIAKDPDQDGDYLKQTIFSVGWQHYWIPHLYSQLNVGYTVDKYTGAFDVNGVLRDENLLNTSVKLAYKFNRNVEFGVLYTYNDKSSSWNNYQYNQNVYLINGKLEF